MTWLWLLAPVFAASATNIPATYEKLRELQILARVPTEACKVDQKIVAGIGGAVEEQQSSLLEIVKDIPVKASDEKFLKKKAASCAVECGCQALSDLMQALPQKDKFEKEIAEADKSASSMTDKNYSVCQKKKKINCAGKEIQDALKQAQESAE